jgi:hypothetical protein
MKLTQCLVIAGLAGLLLGSLSGVGAQPSTADQTIKFPSLSAAQLKQITAPVTREQQIKLLQAGPVAVRRQLQTALALDPGALSTTAGVREKLWRDGFTLLPYAVSYPPPQDNTLPLAELRARHVQIRDNHFPPRPDQPNPLLDLWNPNEKDEPTLFLYLHKPGKGLFMLTVSGSLSGYIVGKPLLMKWSYPFNSKVPRGETELLPNETRTHWSCLLPLENEERVYVGLWGPRVVSLGGITLRKL